MMFTRKSIGPKTQRAERERGATAVEYALVAAAMMIPLSLVVSSFQDRSGTVINETGTRAGTPAEYSEGVTP
jgi:Flp pilus assembly pilin Flp